jgi:hypothetical protein
MRTVSTKPTGTLTEQCDRCGLFFQWLHPGPGGRFLCRVCTALAGENRSASSVIVTDRRR